MSNPRNDNEFGRTQEYVISQIKHHVGLQMGYNVTAIGEFTGSPRRLRFGLLNMFLMLHLAVERGFPFLSRCDF